MTDLFRRAKSRAMERELRRTLGGRFSRRATEQAATVLDSGQLSIGGQRYPATGVSAAPGQTVTVRNIGRAGNALYAPAVGNVTITSGGKASGAGASGATTVLDLTDTPSSYSGKAGYFLRVDSTPSAVEFGQLADADLAPTTAVLEARTVSAGDGLSGGGDLSADRTLAVNSTVARSTWPINAGAGLTDGGNLSSSGVTLNVGAGTMITVNANDVAVQAGSTYQFIGTGSGTAAGWRNVSELAGAGLTVATGILAVGAGDGIDTSADAIAVDVTDIIGAGLTEDDSNNLGLQTPGSISVSTDNDPTGNHKHAVISSSDPGAAESLLATDDDGQLTVEILRARDHIEAADTGRPAIKIRRLSGQTSYLWRVEDESQGGLVGVTKEGDLESLNPGFTSGLAGWQIKAGGDAEFNNIRARGELHATTFVADEMHALGGTFVALNATTTSAEATTGGNPGDTIAAYTWHPVSGPITYPSAVAIDGFTLPVSASWDTGLCYFADGDILRIKSLGQPVSGSNLDLYDIYLEVDGSPSSNSDRDMANGNPGTYDVPVVLRYPTSGANGITIPAGASVVKWGENSGSGYTGGLLFTSDLGDAPYMDIFTVDSSGAAWPPAVVPRVRVGNLDGVLGLSEQWGIAAGADLTDTGADAAYMVLSDTQQTTNNINSRWKSSGVTWAEFDPSGLRAKFGTNTASATTTLIDLNVGAGTLTIGNATSPAAVTVTGTINIQNPGDIDTSALNNDAGWTDDTAADAAAAAAATAIANAATAQSTADGKIDTFYASSEPAGASEGDLWFDTDDGNKLYRHNGSGWVEIQDDAIARAISDAAGAQATADGKVTTYYAASTSAPSSPDTGDLWYQTDTYLIKRWSGSAWATVGNAYTNTSQLTDGAGLGQTAAWGSVSSIPARFGNAPSGAGLFLTATHMGYYDSSAWKTYADSSGNFYLSGSGSHSLSWNGSALTIAGSITVLGGNAATTTDVSNAQTAAQSYADSRDALVQATADAAAAAAGGLVSSLTTAWGSTTVPDRFGNTPSDAGLYLTATHMGYYNASAWKTYMDEDGNFYLSGSGSHSLSWNGSSLTIAGDITVLGGNAATTTYADSAAGTAQSNAQSYADSGDSSTLSSAQSYADSAAGTAQTTAQTHAGLRRVLAVGGTWTSVDADTISWTSASVQMGDGNTYSLADGDTGTLAGLSYLYVNVTTSSPWTVSKTTSLATLTTAHAVIAIAQPGAVAATVRSAAGVTMISGDQILTGTIVADNIKAGTITGAKLSSATTITAGSGTDVGVLDGADATWRIYAGHSTPAGAPFRVNKTGALFASGATISGTITATAGQLGSMDVAGTLSVGTSGKIASGISSWGTGTGYLLDYNGGAPRFLAGTLSSGTLTRGMAWDGSNLKVKMTDGGINLLTIGDTAQAGFIDIDTRQSSGAGTFDYGIHISDGGNTSAGVSALYHGESSQGANAIDRIFDAYTSDSGNVADGYYADIAGGSWNSSTPWDSNGVAFKGESTTAPAIAVQRQGSGLAPTIWASGNAPSAALYSAQIGASGQTAFYVNNDLGADFVAMYAADGPITYIKWAMFKDHSGTAGDVTSSGAVPNPPSGYLAVYGRLTAMRYKNSSGTEYSF